jgi:hypothetical protein
MNNKALMGFAISAVAVVAGLYLYDYIKESGSSSTTPPPAGMAFRGSR